MSQSTPEGYLLHSCKDQVRHPRERGQANWRGGGKKVEMSTLLVERSLRETVRDSGGRGGGIFASFPISSLLRR